MDFLIYTVTSTFWCLAGYLEYIKYLHKKKFVKHGLLFTQREGKNTTVLSFSLWAENRDTGREKKEYFSPLSNMPVLYISTVHVHMWEGKKNYKINLHMH